MCYKKVCLLMVCVSMLAADNRLIRGKGSIREALSRPKQKAKLSPLKRKPPTVNQQARRQQVLRRVEIQRLRAEARRYKKWRAMYARCKPSRQQFWSSLYAR